MRPGSPRLGEGVDRPPIARPRPVGAIVAASHRRLVAVALAATAAVFAEWAAITLQSYDFGIRTFDSVWYHLPWAAWFAQTGPRDAAALHRRRVPDAVLSGDGRAASTGSGSSCSRATPPRRASTSCGSGSVLLAGYCIGRPRGVGALTLTATALAMAIPAIDISQAGSAANDVVGVFFVLAAVALLLNGAERARRRTCSRPSRPGSRSRVKLSMVAPVLALTIGAIALVAARAAPRRRALLARSAAARRAASGTCAT